MTVPRFQVTVPAALRPAAFLPWPAASISVVGPVTKSPQANTPLTFVA